MKKFAMSLLSCALLLGACSKDEEKGENHPYGTLRFEVAAQSAPDTRAGLNSQEPIHSVADVKVYVFRKSGSNYLYHKTFAMPWSAGASFGRYDVPTAEMVPAGDYKFLAVGRDAGDRFSLPALTANTTDYNDIVVSVTAAGQETEIFSGTYTATVSSEGMRIPVTITRQVAGVLGYFKNVPANIGGTTVKYLRLSISNSNKNLNLTTGLGSNPTGTSFNLINVDLSSQTVNGDGAYTGNDLSAQGVVKLPNSQLNGAFVVPVTGVTLTLGLYDAANAPLKTWTVLNDNAESSFSIVANHFYALGTKVAAGSTTGTPERPVADAPIDLMKDQAITVTVLPNWAFIHNMTLQ
ncbi:FimB/Mfa2 family fimbrial subunit [uncultured Alistipes sp.]|uniref:FimB/Mfa2 family fimbrial subunit n=1 Tax=uncultured Alistipes sp. TaxID=538949 RepID=UPI0026350C57|nr:FimB/Mfa2 family fimbrial subunit [uncultured Alistipes sp.]